MCEQEGPGPCLTCGTELFSKVQEQRLIKLLQKKKKGKDAAAAAAAAVTTQALPTQAPDHTPSADEARFYEEAMTKAEAFKNRLLEFDRTSARRTHVIGTSRECTQWNAR